MKIFVGLFLVPPAWILTRTFLDSLVTALRHGLLASQTFICFAGGMLLFGILFATIPRNILMLPYVFGHEVTHALWVKLFGGRVADRFHVSPEGGHVLADRINTWIVLAPYFFPIYSVLVLSLYGVASLAGDISFLHWLLFLLLGLTLAFHLVFTSLLIAKGQPDLHYGGTFFSIVLIYLINLILITGLLLVTSRGVTPASFGHLFVENTISFIELCQSAASLIADWIGELRAGLGNT